jgi:predicted ABC-type ATPase
MDAARPNVVVIAGPNGSGKSTLAPALLRDYAGILEFVNADTLAQGLSGFNEDSVAFEAGRIMHARLRELADSRADFAFETTLASRSLAPWLAELRASGYMVHINFLWLPSPEMAIARVKARVAQGGHDVPESTIVRRYHAGLKNFFQLYQPVVVSWTLFDNSGNGAQREIAARDAGATVRVHNQTAWEQIQQDYA